MRFQRLWYENLHKIYVKQHNRKLYYQQLHLKYSYLCNLARYWLQAPWGWKDRVETCRSVIICDIIVHLLVIVQNNTNVTLRELCWCLSLRTDKTYLVLLFWTRDDARNSVNYSIYIKFTHSRVLGIKCTHRKSNLWCHFPHPYLGDRKFKTPLAYRQFWGFKCFSSGLPDKYQ